jgi:hypothetical protein
MIDRGPFPWRPALAACALLSLALLTVAIRADVVREGQELMRREHVRHSLRRHARDLSLRLQSAAHDLGASEHKAAEKARKPGKAVRS